MSTPSELLSRAADLIRDTAVSAFHGPWTSGERCVWADEDALDAVVDDGVDGSGGVINEETARWIALLNPAVAPAIEGMLRSFVPLAKAVEEMPGVELRMGDETASGYNSALGFARAVLGLVDTPKETT